MKNPSQAQELAKQFEVDQATVPRLHEMGKIKKFGKWVWNFAWIVAKQHYPSIEYAHFIAFQAAQERFLWKIVIGDEM